MLGLEGWKTAGRSSWRELQDFGVLKPGWLQETERRLCVALLLEVSGFGWLPWPLQLIFVFQQTQLRLGTSTPCVAQEGAELGT